MRFVFFVWLIVDYFVFCCLWVGLCLYLWVILFCWCLSLWCGWNVWNLLVERFFGVEWRVNDVVSVRGKVLSLLIFVIMCWVMILDLLIGIYMFVWISFFLSCFLRKKICIFMFWLIVVCWWNLESWLNFIMWSRLLWCLVMLVCVV